MSPVPLPPPRPDELRLAELRSYAFELDAHAGRVPSLDDPIRHPDIPGMTAQLTDLAGLVTRIATALGDDHRRLPKNPTPTWRRQGAALGEALRWACYSAADLGTAVENWQPVVQDDHALRPVLTEEERQEAYAIVAHQLDGARFALTRSATVLHSAVHDLAPTPVSPAVRLARARSTAPGPGHPAPAPDGPSTAPQQPSVKGRTP